jgi:formate hydrogenlyase subunit 6/NADH:ubiquinone oxidoreductase subunit I
MLKILAERWRQGHRTSRFPNEAPVLSDRFRGLPIIDASKCPDGCRACVDACPTDAITIEARVPKVDLGRCLFCTDCTQACPTGAIRHGPDFHLAGNTRQSLIVGGGQPVPVHALEKRLLRLFGRSR